MSDLAQYYEDEFEARAARMEADAKSAERECIFREVVAPLVEALVSTDLMLTLLPTRDEAEETARLEVRVKAAAAIQAASAQMEGRS